MVTPLLQLQQMLQLLSKVGIAVGVVRVSVCSLQKCLIAIFGNCSGKPEETARSQWVFATPRGDNTHYYIGIPSYNSGNSWIIEPH